LKRLRHLKLIIISLSFSPETTAVAAQEGLDDWCNLLGEIGLHVELFLNINEHLLILKPGTKKLLIKRLEYYADDIPSQKGAYTNLFQDLTKLEELEHFKLSIYESPVKVEMFEELIRFIGQSQLMCLKTFSLELESCEINEKAILPLIEGISVLKTITRLNLDLRNIQLSHQNYEKLIFGISKLQAIEQLDLLISQPEAITNLKLLGQQKMLKTLNVDLSNMLLEHKAQREFYLCLKRMSLLQELGFNLNDSNLSDHEIRSIGQSISELDNLKSLSMSLCDNRITDQGWAYLGEALKYAKSLENLTLIIDDESSSKKFSNTFTDKGLRSLAEGIKGLSELSRFKLKIHRNLVSNDAVLELCQSLRTCRFLKYVYLYLDIPSLGESELTKISLCILRLKFLVSFLIEFDPKLLLENHSVVAIDKFLKMKRAYRTGNLTFGNRRAALWIAV